jgi:O-antigen ligase
MFIALLGIALAGVMVAAFAFGLRTGVSALILMRPLCDRIFESSRLDGAGSTVSPGAIINVAVICAMLFSVGLIWRRVPSGLRTAWLPFLLVAFVAVLYSPEQALGFRRFVAYVSYSGMFMFPFMVARSESDVFYYLKWMILSSVLPVLYGIFQAVSGIDWHEYATGYLEPTGYRIQSTFPHPNIFAFYIIAIVGIIFFLLATDRGRMGERLRIVLTLYLVPLFALLIMTKTRSAWASCIILILVYGLVYDKRALVLVVLAPLLAFVVPAISERLLDLFAKNYYGGGSGSNLNAYAWREVLWASSFTYIWESPLFGYGLESFSHYSPQFFPLNSKDNINAHNVYIQLLFEMGFVGLCAFLWIFLRSYAWLILRWHLDRRGSIMAGGILASYLISCYSDNLLNYLSFNWCFWFGFGLIFTRFVHLRDQVVGEQEQRGRQLGAIGARNVRTARSSLAN